MSEADRITSDKDVGNVTKRDIDVLNELINAYEAGLPGCNELMNSEVSAIKNILAELEQMIKEREKCTIRLTDEEYRKVIENAQMDTSNGRAIAIKFATMQQQINEKDKRIQELEEVDEANKKVIVEQCDYIQNESIPKQVVIDILQDNRNELFGMTCLSKEQYRPYEMQIERINKIEQELLGGENENRA